MSQYDEEKITLLREYINTMTLSQDDFLTEAFKKIKEKRSAYMALSNKSDTQVATIIDPNYKRILTLSEDALDMMCRLLSKQSKHFQRFMNVVSMRRMKGEGSIQERAGWNRYIEMIKEQMFTHSKKKLINNMISKLSTTSEG